MLATLPGRSRRNGLFTEALLRDGRVRAFAGRLETWPVAPLDDTPEAAAEMCRRLGLDGAMLNIQTFDNRAGGNVLYKALAHPLAAEAIARLYARLRAARWRCTIRRASRRRCSRCTRRRRRSPVFTCMTSPRSGEDARRLCRARR